MPETVWQCQVILQTARIAKNPMSLRPRIFRKITHPIRSVLWAYDFLCGKVPGSKGI